MTTVWGIRRPALLTRREHFVGVICVDHPMAAKARRKRVTLDDYLAHPHIMVALRNPGKSPIDDALENLGRSRRIAGAAPSFAASAAALAGADLIMTLPSRLLPTLGRGLATFPLPFSLPDFFYYLIWHNRSAADPALAWLRALVLAHA